MGDAQHDSNNKTMSFLLPPGCRFYPSEEELLRYYLTNKNTNTSNEDGDLRGYDLIKELDLYDYEPYELPERTCYAYGCGGRKRHWYCYSKVRVTNGNGREKRRIAKNGFWRRRGRVKDVVAVNRGEKVVVGIRKRFVFYLGNSPETAVRTDWVLYEYQLADHVKAAFVVCRVFKSHSGNSVSEIGVSSGVEESVSAVRHIGVQHDGSLLSSFVEANLHDDNITDGRLVSQIDNRVIQVPVPVASFQFPMDTPPSEQVSTSGRTVGDMFVEAATVQQLLSILAEDYIELDDLVP